MTYITTTLLTATWHADDLYRYDCKSNLNFVSAHDHVINLQLNSSDHLLMIGDSELEYGPATVAVTSNNFAYLKSLTGNHLTGYFSDSNLKIISGADTCIIKWKEGEPLSFSAQRYENVNYTAAKKVIESYKNKLAKAPLPTSAAALFNMPGGDIFFRQQITNYFPHIVDALINTRKQEFIDNCRNITGMGRGLTPSGDDLIHGALIAFHYFAYDIRFIRLIKNDFYSLMNHTNLFGRHMLSLGLAGLTSRSVINFLNTITGGIPTTEKLDRLLSLGSSTGHDIAVAIIYFIETYLDNTNKYIS